MRPAEPKPIEIVAARMQREILDLHSPAALAEAFWALYSTEQVEFFERLATLIGSTYKAQTQGYYTRDMLTPECETALEMFRCMLEAPNDRG